ncbi:flagellar basal body P-ring formation protein FlgA [Palleronia sediminis]|uniref:Flagella basal body P-ring formation protein FlgA n=1 Tax=Palleronia sediminis TaxID=2547833 RepID=A0A4V3B855_9RHOB|nr:flagellar basal body P-ring formation chaperone FlgA [Palleronia sediminis]TDL74209.1 flagellar basal body P-ring formation protein FlgA [Palleronia sediminis]
MRGLLALALLLATPAAADTLVAARTIRAQALLGPADLAILPGDLPGALARPSEAVGLEARVTLYAGRPIRPGDIGPPAIVERNQIVTMIFEAPGMRIVADARALDRAGVGDRVRAMNLGSRSTVVGTVTEAGTIVVGGGAS